MIVRWLLIPVGILRFFESVGIAVLSIFLILGFIIFGLFEERTIKIRKIMRYLLQAYWFIHIGLLVRHFEDCFFDLIYLLDDFIKHCLWIVCLFADKDVSHTLSNKFKGLHIVLIFIEIGDVILEVYFWFSCFFFDLFK